MNTCISLQGPESDVEHSMGITICNCVSVLRVLLIETPTFKANTVIVVFPLQLEFQGNVNINTVSSFTDQISLLDCNVNHQK